MLGAKTCCDGRASVPAGGLDGARGSSELEGEMADPLAGGSLKEESVEEAESKVVFTWVPSYSLRSL